jgi:hypothetical protein
MQKPNTGLTLLLQGDHPLGLLAVLFGPILSRASLDAIDSIVERAVHRLIVERGRLAIVDLSDDREVEYRLA